MSIYRSNKKTQRDRVVIINSNYCFANTNYHSTCESKIPVTLDKGLWKFSVCYHVFSSPAASHLHAEARRQPGCIVLNRPGCSGGAALSCILQHPGTPLRHPNTSHPFLLDFVLPKWSKEALKKKQQHTNNSKKCSWWLLEAYIFNAMIFILFAS